MQTHVTFRSTAFNCTEPKDYFINECCFGDDLARWLMRQLQSDGVKTADEPGQEDFGWYFTYEAGGIEHCFVIGFQPNDPHSGDQWLGSIERSTGLLGSIFGGRRRGISEEAIQVIDRALRSSTDIHDVTWHEEGV